MLSTTLNYNKRNPASAGKKVFCIVGATATGKTALAVSLSQQIPSVLISADSRQVYRGMDIVTGKDHDPNITLAGIDLVNPDQECSVAVWHDSIKSFLSIDKLPIVVGGTGFYVKALTGSIETMDVKPNKKLRAELELLSVAELQIKLKSIDPNKYSSMNNSDINNPRRLIRAIEVGSNRTLKSQTNQPPDSLIVGLRYEETSNYESIIKERVEKRIELGAIEETKKLFAKYAHDLPSLTAIGYRSIGEYLAGELTKEQLIDKWVSDELAYAKRQMTWFKKVPAIQWFAVEDENRAEKIAKLVSKWYAKRAYAYNQS